MSTSDSSPVTVASRSTTTPVDLCECEACESLEPVIQNCPVARVVAGQFFCARVADAGRFHVAQRRRAVGQAEVHGRLSGGRVSELHLGMGRRLRLGMTSPERPLEISCQRLAKLLREQADLLLIDCREAFEHDIVAIQGAWLVPMSGIEQRLTEINQRVAGEHGDGDEPPAGNPLRTRPERAARRHVVVYCHPRRAERQRRCLASLSRDEASTEPRGRHRSMGGRDRSPHGSLLRGRSPSGAITGAISAHLQTRAVILRHSKDREWEAAVAELADAHGSGPCPHHRGWGFDSLRRHSYVGSPRINALLAFSYLARLRAELLAARNMTTYIVFLSSHPCDASSLLVS